MVQFSPQQYQDRENATIQVCVELSEDISLDRSLSLQYAIVDGPTQSLIAGKPFGVSLGTSALKCTVDPH